MKASWPDEALPMDRRRFLGTVAATPLIAGIENLSSGPPIRKSGDGPPAFWRETLERMKATNRPGLVLVAPRDQDERRRFGEKLYELLDLDEAEDFDVPGRASSVPAMGGFRSL